MVAKSYTPDPFVKRFLQELPPDFKHPQFNKLVEPGLQIDTIEMIRYLLQHHSEAAGIEMLIQFLKKVTAKGVKDQIIECLKEFEISYEIAHKLIKEKKQHPRHIGVELLIYFNKPGDQTVLKKLSQNDQNELIKSTIKDHLARQ